MGDLKEHPEIIAKAYELCEKHPEERLETYCYTHDEPCCVRCVVNTHRLCSDIVPIDQWVRETQNAQEPSELLQELNKLAEKEDTRHFDVVKYMSLNEKITKMRSEIDEHLDKVEKKLREGVTRFMETAGQNKDKSPIHFAKLYLQKLIKNGTSVHLLASMKQLRTLMEIIEKRWQNRTDEPIQIEFNHYIQQFTTLTPSFGKIVQDSDGDDDLTLQVPYLVLDERRPPLPEDRKKTFRDTKTSYNKKSRADKESVENSIDMYTRNTQQNEDTFNSDSSKKNRNDRESYNHKNNDTLTNEIDNIAVIERKLKIFIDKHITKVNEEDLERKRREHIYSFADDEVFENNTSYAKVDKRIVNKEPAEIQNKRKQSERKKTRKPSLDPEKEKLNALINNYLRKNENRGKKTILSNTKSFYFSNPDISSSAKGNTQTAMEYNYIASEINKGIESQKRRNSLQAANPKDDDEDYDHIDYDSPFLDPSYMPMAVVIKQDDEKKDTTLDVPTDADKHITDDNTNVNNGSEILSTPFQIYSPQSQIKAAETLSNQKKEFEKGKTPHKGFFEKAKGMFRFNRKQGKFDLDVATKDSIFNNDPMNEPIYMGTPYENPIKKAAHAITPKSTQKASPYEQNFDVIYQDYEKSEPKEGNVYETCFQLLYRKDTTQENKESYVENNTNEIPELIEVKLLVPSMEESNPTEAIVTRPELKVHNEQDNPFKESVQEFEIFDVEEEYFTQKEATELNIKPVTEDQPSRFNANFLGELKSITNAKAKKDVTIERKGPLFDDDCALEKEINKPSQSSNESKQAEKSVMPLRNPSFLGALRNPQKIPEVKPLIDSGESEEPNIPKSKAAGMNPLFLGELRKRLQVKPTTSTLPDHNTTDPDKDVTGTVDKTEQEASTKARPLPPKRLTPVKNSQAETSKPENKTVLYEATARNDFNVQSGNTLITGGVFNCQGKLLLIDNNERKLYVFTLSAECEDVLIFKEKPFDITTVNANVVAITFPDSESVDLIDLIKMKIIKNIHVGEKCYGIDYDSKNLIVRCIESIKVVNLMGAVLNTIHVQSSPAGYVAHYQNNIYYSYNSSLLSIDITGNEQFAIQDPHLETIEGIATDFEGNIYVTGKNSNNVWEISGTDGSQRRKIIPVLVAPKVIAFNETKNRFLVTYDKSNTVIYDLKSTYGSVI